MIQLVILNFFGLCCLVSSPVFAQVLESSDQNIESIQRQRAEAQRSIWYLDNLLVSPARNFFYQSHSACQSFMRLMPTISLLFDGWSTVTSLLASTRFTASEIEDLKIATSAVYDLRLEINRFITLCDEKASSVGTPNSEGLLPADIHYEKFRGALHRLIDSLKQPIKAGQ